MKIQKILMVEPKAPGVHVYSIVRLPRLGLPILGTLASRRGYDVRIVIEEMTPVNYKEVFEADLLCISTITPTAPNAYRIADRARAAGVKVVMGGAHVTFLPDEALDHADWVLGGEAEKSFVMFLDMLQQDTGPEGIPGLSYWRDGRKVHNPASTDPVDMNMVPIPDFSLLAGRKTNKFDRGVIPIQTSRGCPHQCNFCSVTPMFGRKMRFVSNEHVAEELESRRGTGDGVFFYDDNFCGSPARAKSLLDHLMSRNIFLPPWLAQVSVRAAKDLELLKLMQRSNCHTVFVGFESVNPDSLKLYHKSQSLDDMRQAIRRFRRHGIWVHGMFMTGSDADRVETIRATSRFAIEEKIDTIQFMVLTPLPGTQVYDEMNAQGRLLTRDWALYDAHHAVFQPAQMSPLELMNESMNGMLKVYSPSRILGNVVRGQARKFVFNLYARRQLKRWLRSNRDLLQAAKEEEILSIPLVEASPNLKSGCE